MLTYVHQSEVKLELGKNVILTTKGQVIKYWFIVYNNKCPNCQHPMEPGKEEEFQKVSGTCYHCTPGEDAITLGENRCFCVYVEPKHLNAALLEIKKYMPNAKIETNLNYMKEKIYIRVNYDGAEFYLTKKKYNGLRTTHI